MKCFVRSVRVKIKTGPRKALEETRVALNAVNESSSRFPGPSDDVSVFENEIVEDDPCWDFVI